MTTPLSSGHLLTIASIISIALAAYSALGERLRVLKAIFGQKLERATTEATRVLIQGSLQEVTKASLMSGADAGAFAEIISLGSTSVSHRNAFDQVYVSLAKVIRYGTNVHRILPAVRANAAKTHFAVSFLAAWGATVASQFDKAYIESVYGNIAQAMLSRFHVGYENNALF